MIYLLIVSLIWSFSFGLIKSQLTDWDPVFVAFLRLLISSLLFLPFLRIERTKITLYLKLVIVGAIQYGVMYIAYIYSYQFLKAYEVALLTIFTPLFVILIDTLIVRKLSLYFLISAVGAILGSGIILLKAPESENLWLGIILVQIANLCFAAGQIFYKKILENESEYKEQKLFALLYLGATLIPGLFWIGGGMNFPVSINPSKLFAIFYLGILPSGVGFFLWNYGARRVNTGSLSVMNNLKIPLAILISILFFGESADLKSLFVGMLIIIGSLFVSEYSWKRANSDN